MTTRDAGPLDSNPGGRCRVADPRRPGSRRGCRRGTHGTARRPLRPSTAGTAGFVGSVRSTSHASAPFFATATARRWRRSPPPVPAPRTGASGPGARRSPPAPGRRAGTRPPAQGRPPSGPGPARGMCRRRRVCPPRAAGPTGARPAGPVTRRDGHSGLVGRERHHLGRVPAAGDAQQPEQRPVGRHPRPAEDLRDGDVERQGGQVRHRGGEGQRRRRLDGELPEVEVDPGAALEPAEVSEQQRRDLQVVLEEERQRVGPVDDRVGSLSDGPQPRPSPRLGQLPRAVVDPAGRPARGAEVPARWKQEHRWRQALVAAAAGVAILRG